MTFWRKDGVLIRGVRCDDCPCGGAECQCGSPTLYLTLTGLFLLPYVLAIPNILPCTWHVEVLEPGSYSIFATVVLHSDDTFTVGFAIFFDDGCSNEWNGAGDIEGDCANLAGVWASQFLDGGPGCADYTVSFTLSQTP